MTRDAIHASLAHDTDLDRDLEDHRDAWNHLRQFAMSWKDDPDFDATRWPRAVYVPLRAADERPAGAEPDAAGLPPQPAAGKEPAP
ncbi:hypothetical protein [Streptomyces sp. WG7]|uniref:hypothetical protein n=1 Tax=Streptomyces sp. WG7 TaxID=3417650 RepID=UPI003CF776CE